MTCKVYSKAETAARDAVIQALYDNVDKETLDQLWGHYLGLRTIHEEHTHSDTVTVPEGVDVYDNIIQFPTQTNIDLDIASSYNSDTITSILRVSRYPAGNVPNWHLRNCLS